MMRIFTIAVESDIKLVERLTFIQEDLGKIVAARGADSRWVRPEHLQVPLLCLGRHDEDAIPEFNEILREVANRSQKFTMTTSQISAYPSPETPRLIQVSAFADNHLVELRERLMEAFRAANISFDGRPFRATMLLGRVATNAARINLSDAVRAIQELNFGQSEIFEFALCSANLTENGTVHRIISRFFLGGTPQ